MAKTEERYLYDPPDHRMITAIYKTTAIAIEVDRRVLLDRKV